MNGLPGLRLLPDAPRPGRSHRTHQARSAQRLQRLGQGEAVGHLAPFIPDTNAIEALNRQLRKMIKTQGQLPQRGRRPQADLPRDHPERRPANGAHPQLDAALTAFKIHFGDRIPT